MNLSPTTVFILGAGFILIYSAVKDKNPQDVIKETLGVKPRYERVPLPPSSDARGRGRITRKPTAYAVPYPDTGS